MEPLDLATRLVLVLHRREVSKTTNTGSTAARCVVGSEIRVRGDAGHALDCTDLAVPERRLWLLFPAEGATLLTPALVGADPRPVTLVVPDGTWGQASRVAARVPGLRDGEALPVTLLDGPPTRYRLRREIRPGGLATFEAIARALGVLEGPEVQARLERVFDALVEGTLAMRMNPPGNPGSVHPPT